MTIIITLDGHAASGKGTLARKIANHFDYFYFDTGKIYRLIGMQAKHENLDPDKDTAAIIQLAHNVANGFNIDDLNNPDLKSDIAGQMASKCGAIPELRAAILDLQKTLAYNPPSQMRGSVMDGRDCGTVICPDAHYKFFVTADLDVRAKRRFEELKNNGDASVTYENVMQEMKIRDERDSGRKDAPLKPASDAVIVDTTAMTINDAFTTIINHIEK